MDAHKHEVMHSVHMSRHFEYFKPKHIFDYYLVHKLIDFLFGLHAFFVFIFLNWAEVWNLLFAEQLID